MCFTNILDVGTVPENYTEGISNTQRYKVLGNGWTVDVIKHIFKEMDFSKSEINNTDNTDDNDDFWS